MKKFITFTLLIMTSLVFCQFSKENSENIEKEIKDYISKSITNYRLEIQKENKIKSSMQKEAVEHKLSFSQKKFDEVIYAHKTFELRKKFFKENPTKTYTSQDLLKANKGINQICTDGGFEGGLPTINPFVFTFGINDGNNGADIDTSGFTQFFPNTTSINNFAAYATLVDTGVDPNIANVARVNTCSRAIKLNFADDQTNEVVTMSRNLTVNQDFFDFNYNLVLNDPGINHTLLQKPFLSVRIYDIGRVLIRHIDILTDPADCSLTSNIAQPPFNGTVLTTGWRCARINTADLNILQENVTIEFVISDCAFGGHYGTVYIDDICNTNCTNPMFGRLNLDYKEGVICPTTTQAICGTYQLPFNSQYQNMTLNVLQNGLVVGSIPAPSNLTSNAFCFNVPLSTFGTNPIGDFEYQVVGNFIRTCAINYQLQPLVATSTDFLNPDVMFYPINAVNDNFTLNNCSNPTFNILANDVNLSCNFVATTSNVIITQQTTNPNIVLNTATGLVSLIPNAPIGIYSINYLICSSINTTIPCRGATISITKNAALIDAVNDDISSTPFIPCTNNVITTLLQNDLLCSTTVNINDINISLVAPISVVGATINATSGAITIPNNTPAGTYTLTYKICQKNNPSNCDTATVKFKINTAIIVAGNDNFNAVPINNVTGGSTTSVLINDTLNGLSITPSSNLTITLQTPLPIIGATINNLGILTVPPNTATGYYTFTYKIGNCITSKTATIKVFVTSPAIIFGTTRANSLINLIELQSTGKIIIGGVFVTYNNIPFKYLARLNADLTLDNTFTNYFATNTIHTLWDMKVLPNDKIIVIKSDGRGIERLNSNGSVDNTFNIGGIGFSGQMPKSCKIQNDGKILVANFQSMNYNGFAVKNLIRLNANGTLDNSFQTPFTDVEVGGLGIQQSSVRTIAIQPDGKIIVASTIGQNVTPIIVGKQPTLCRLLPNGQLDTTFQLGWAPAPAVSNCNSCIGSIQDIEVLTDGKIIIAGSFVNYNGQPAKNIVKLSSTGQRDIPFTNATGTSTDRAIKDVEQELDINTNETSGLFLAGEFSTYNNSPADRITKIDLNGTKSTTFNSGATPIVGYYYPVVPNTNPPTYAETKTIYVLKRQGDAKLILGGIFSKYNGINAENITRINPAIGGNQSRNSINNLENNIFDSDKETVKVYPNPFTNTFSIDLSVLDNDYDNITIVNVLGEVVYKSVLIAKTLNEIDVADLQKGYYFAKIASEKDSFLIKLIKN